MVEKITEHVNANFNVKAVKPYADKGKNTVYVQFVIDPSGEIRNVKSRGPSKEVEDEAKRTIMKLPKMKPAQNNGADAATLYSLPIVFEN